MNAQALHHGKMSSNVLLGGLFSRRSVWSNPQGGMVTRAKPEAATPLTATRVSWEAYVVESETEEADVLYPRIVHTSTFNVLGAKRPTDEIRAQYLAEVRGQVTEDDYAELTAKITSGELLIATTINNSKAA